jgi:hypothetical protein
MTRYLPDLLVLAGLGLIAYGLGQLPAPWGAVTAPLALGVGLLLVVRYGRET